jgi:hypothetical protein
MAIAERDPGRARDVGRRAVASYLTAPGYRDNLERLGFTADDMEEKSDRLVDALVAWGGDEEIHQRLDQHFAAGADHVCVQALRADSAPGPDVELLERLAWGFALPARRAAATQDERAPYSPPR